MIDYQILHHGDSGIVVEFDKQVTETAWAHSQYLANCLRQDPSAGVKGVIPAYASVFIHIDLWLTEPGEMIKKVAKILEQPFRTDLIADSARQFRIPVLYGGKWGADLDQVASQLGLSQEEVVERHYSKPYKILCLGTPIGQPMMDGVPYEGEVSRLAAPRTKVPTGSVALAGKQTIIYTADVPGGWQLIGWTPIQLTDIGKVPPVAFRPGDYLEFFPIRERELDKYAGKSVDEMLVDP